jgi:hypothetical protein
MQGRRRSKRVGGCGRSDASFRSVPRSAYELTLHQISAHVLSTFYVYFFNQLTFAIPHFSHFIQTSENLSFNAAELAFERDFVELTTVPHEESWKLERPLNLRITCQYFDWQVSSATQILGSLSPVFSVVESLTLVHMEHNPSSELHNDIDRPNTVAQTSQAIHHQCEDALRAKGTRRGTLSFSTFGGWRDVSGTLAESGGASIF